MGELKFLLEMLGKLERIVGWLGRTERVYVDPSLKSNLKEGDEDEEEQGKKAMGKEKETSFPSSSWRQKAQIPPAMLFL
ncbi:hypothetical protein ACSBR1_020973 [Camellia fascicularis]